MIIGTKRVEECAIYDSHEGIMHFAPGQYVEIYFDRMQGWMFSAFTDTCNHEAVSPYVSSQDAYESAQQSFDIEIDRVYTDEWTQSFTN